MVVLLDLPVEMLEIITSNVHPADIENFAATCKLLAELSKPKLALHAQRKKQYSDLAFNMDILGKPITRCKSASPLIFLRDVCRDDSLLFYPRRIRLDNFHYIADSIPVYPTPPIKRRRRRFGQWAMNGCAETIKAKLAAYVDQQDSASLSESIEHGNCGAGIGVLLLLLENVELLHVYLDPTHCLSFNFRMRYAGVCSGAAVPGKHYPTGEAQAGVLKHLAFQWAQLFDLPIPTTARLIREVINVRAAKMGCFEIFSGGSSLVLKPFLVNRARSDGLRCSLLLRDDSKAAKEKLDTRSSDNNGPNQADYMSRSVFNTRYLFFLKVEI